MKWVTEHERKAQAAAQEAAATAPSGLMPEPWKLHDAGRRNPYWWRECEPDAKGLAAALAELPPDTALETATGPDQCGTPDNIAYYPHLGYATI